MGKQMKIKYLFSILTFIISTQSLATLYRPLSVSEHVKESDAFILGQVVSIETFKNEKGLIETKVNFKLSQWMGLDQKRNDPYFEMTFPGGRFGDEVTHIPGNIKFSLGEKVLLLLKQNENGFSPVNLALSKYSVKRVGRGEIVINQVFPQHSEIGQIPLEFISKKIESLHKKKFTYAFKDKYEMDNMKSMAKEAKRGIASVNNEEKIEETKNSILWLMIIFAIMSGLIVIYRKEHE
jgi:hypothetical protein